MGLFDDLDLLDPDDRAEAVDRFTRANEEWADFCRRHTPTGSPMATTRDDAVAAEAKQRVDEIEAASRELYTAFDVAISRM